MVDGVQDSMMPSAYKRPAHTHISDNVCLVYIFPVPLVLPALQHKFPACLVLRLFTSLACRLTTPTPPTKKRRRKQDKKCQHAIKPHHATARTWPHLPPPSCPTTPPPPSLHHRPNATRNTPPPPPPARRLLAMFTWQSPKVEYEKELTRNHIHERYIEGLPTHRNIWFFAIPSLPVLSYHDCTADR